MSDWLVDDTLAPPVTERCEPFHAAASNGRVVLPSCEACAGPVELDQVACHRCGAVGTVWHEVPRRAKVHASSLVHRVAPPQILSDKPYLLIDVEFESGHRLVLTTTRPWTEPPEIGLQVPIGFRRVGEVHLPAVDTPFR